MPIGRGMGDLDIRALIVDDDEDMRGLLMDFISRMGVIVSTAASLTEAQAALRMETPPFDLVLADLKLPGGSGMEVVTSAHARCPETLVTIVTGYASLETAIEAIRLGAYDYITKPFTLDEIGVAVRNMIERVSIAKENARLSLRLQELYEQVNRLQEEKMGNLNLQEEIRDAIQRNGRKLDSILSALGSGAARIRSVDPQRNLIAELVGELESLRRLKESSAISSTQFSERKRNLIDSFSEKF